MRPGDRGVRSLGGNWFRFCLDFGHAEQSFLPFELARGLCSHVKLLYQVYETLR
jgi:hypothetical protein